MSNPVGRPSKYSVEYCAMLINHMAQGLSFESFAGVIGVAVDTLYEWRKVHSEFSEAEKIGNGRSRIFWEQLGVSGTVGRPVEYEATDPKNPDGAKIKKLSGNFNAATWIFNMKNRFSWRDKSELSGPGGQPLHDNTPLLKKMADDVGEMVKNANGNATAGEGVGESDSPEPVQE